MWLILCFFYRFAGGDLSTLPLNFSVDIFSCGKQSSDTSDVGKESESDHESHNADTLVPSSALIDKEFRDLRYEVRVFCSEFDRIVLKHVANDAQRRSNSESNANMELTKSLVDKQLTVMVLTYCDLVEMNEATLALLTTSRSSFLRNTKDFNRVSNSGAVNNSSELCCPVIIFAPSCVQERLVVELKLALDRWQRGDGMQFAAHSFDFSGGGSVYSRSSGHSSIHSINLSPTAHNTSVNSINGNHLAVATPRNSSRWSSLRSRSASIDRSSSGSRSSKFEFALFTPQSTTGGSNHNSLGSQHSSSLVNLLMPSSSGPHKDNNNISSLLVGRNYQSNDSMEPFSQLERLDSGSLLVQERTNGKQGLLSPPSLSDIQIPGRIIRVGSGAASQSRPGSGGVQLPPPPPPLIGSVSNIADQTDSRLSTASLRTSPQATLSKEAVDTVSPSLEKNSCDPCLIIVQVVRRIQLEHAVSITVFV